MMVNLESDDSCLVATAKGLKIMISDKGWYTYDVHENCPIFKTPYSPCPSMSTILWPSWPWTSNFNQTLPPPLLLQMLTSQLKENIIQGWILYVIKPFLQVGFRFWYQLINLAWLSFVFFSFTWKIIPAISWLYTLVCAVINCVQLFTFLVLFRD